MRTPQDIINRKEANRRYYELEENKEQKRNYMKTYRTRDILLSHKDVYDRLSCNLSFVVYFLPVYNIVGLLLYDL